MKNNLKYIAYTDGSCNNLSPYGEGGSAYILMYDGIIVKESSKGFTNTTNNRMELLAIVSAAKSTPKGADLVVYTDSKYCITVLTSKKRQKSNTDLIDLFHKSSSHLNNVEFVWVKGHSGDEFNEYVDSLAFSAYEGIIEKYNLPKSSPYRRKK